MLNLASNRNSLARSTKSTRSWRMPLSLLVNIRFQILFHSPPGVLFTVPSRYYALSVTKEYLALGGGPPIFPQGFTCLVVLFCVGYLRFRLQDSYLLGLIFPDYLAGYCLFLHFGLFPVRSPLLRESSFLSFPQVT